MLKGDGLHVDNANVTVMHLGSSTESAATEGESIINKLAEDTAVVIYNWLTFMCCAIEPVIYCEAFE